MSDTVELTDWVRQSPDEPFAWMVFYRHGSPYDHQIFDDFDDAVDFANDQMNESGESSYYVFPLFASHPKDVTSSG